MGRSAPRSQGSSLIPVTTSDVNLCARLSDGHVLHGEAAIDVRTEHREAAIDYIYLDQPAYPTASALDALRSADLVVLGPGDLYTSILPNLLVDGIVEALAEAKQRLYVVNLMTNRRVGWVPRQHVRRAGARISRPHAARRRDGQHNAAVAESLKRYSQEGAERVDPDIEAIEALGVQVVARPIASSRHLMRHDSDGLADAIMEWLSARTEQPSRLVAG